MKTIQTNIGFPLDAEIRPFLAITNAAPATS